MKKLLLIMFSVLVIFFQSNLIAQSEEDEAMPGEFHIAFTNLPSSWAFTVKINAIGTVWDHNHYITSEYLGGEENYDQNCEDCWHASALSWFSPPHEPILSLGLYEIGIWEGPTKRAWFYLDYRTSHLPEASTLQTLDLKFNYNVTNKGFELVYPIAFSGSVINGTYYPIWELIDSVELRSFGLEDYWDNALAAIPQKNPSTGVFEPFLTWGPNNQISSPFVYQIYWRYGEAGSFSLLKTVDENTFTTRHENLEAVGGGSQAYYKVRAYNNQGPDYSDYTNIANIGVGQFYGGQDKKNLYENISNNEYRLMQNYPNPFNPSTIITYQFPEADFVTIKVYDMLGREVDILINGEKDAGTHSIEFDASGLSSGIYFYKIQTNNYVETRKLILQK